MIATVLITLLVTGVALFVLSLIVGVTIGQDYEEVDHAASGVFFVSLVLIVIPGLLLAGMAMTNA